jgi:hypothetical protein
MDRITFIVLLLIAVGCVTTGRSSLAKLPKEKGSKTPAVQVDMRNVMYHFTDQVAVHILHLRGLVLPTQRARLPVFDDVQSSCSRSTSPRLLSARMRRPTSRINTCLLRPTPYWDIAVTTAITASKCIISYAKGDIPFETEGTMSQRQRAIFDSHAQSQRGSVPVKGLCGSARSNRPTHEHRQGARVRPRATTSSPIQPPACRRRALRARDRGAGPRRSHLQVWTRPPAGDVPTQRELYGVSRRPAALRQDYNVGYRPGADDMDPQTL